MSIRSRPALRSRSDWLFVITFTSLIQVHGVAEIKAKLLCDVGLGRVEYRFYTGFIVQYSACLGS